MRLKAVEEINDNDELEDVHFDIAIIIDRQNNVQIVDTNRKKNKYWREDYLNSNTLLVKELKIRV